jgi:glutamate/tyrosine decarboxylase-like PLP-dependent enzyme
MFLALQYYGAKHFSDLVARGYENGEYLLEKLKENGNFLTISPEPLPCLQVCFYYARVSFFLCPQKLDRNELNRTDTSRTPNCPTTQS